ncbi:GH25 family lysozyme [Kineothrix sedimenti]|uniref:GH25 family lysozyme n=1 Tax=Kineothrix sedimenti TaxID=3123317 RepID=A0ABZ3F1V7_9FIRM
MSIKIGHSSIDENNKISGGAAGDQTEKEVCIRSWYSKPWQFVLRCKDSNKAELMANACEKGCTNAAIGYDQGSRNSLNTQAQKVNYDLSKITTPCECDCSSFMTVCAQAAGINIPYNSTNAPTTSTMKSAFLSTGEFEVLTDSKYITTDAYLRRGDILVKAGSHTVMALENGSSYNSSITTSSVNASTQKCIDVSSYQGVINWTQVKNSGIALAILRGVTKNGNMDTTFETNYRNAISAGVNIIGVYHFSYSLDEATAKKDAENMISKLNGKNIEIYLDLEWATQGVLGKSKVTSIAKTYVNTCKSLGYTCHIYSNLDWYKNKYNASELSALGCRFWIARYSSSDDGTVKESLKPNIGEYIWQYSSKGKVSGINGNVDMNVIYNYTSSSTQPATTPSNSITETSITLLGKITTTSSNLTIRSQPNTTSTKLGYYTKASVVQLIAKTSNGWYKTDKGYISVSYVCDAIGQVYNCGGLNFRKSNESEIDNVIETLKPGDEINLLKEENGWYKAKAKLEDGTVGVGWVSKKYIKIL